MPRQMPWHSLCGIERIALGWRGNPGHLPHEDVSPAQGQKSTPARGAFLSASHAAPLLFLAHCPHCPRSHPPSIAQDAPRSASPCRYPRCGCLHEKNPPRLTGDLPCLRQWRGQGCLELDAEHHRNRLFHRMKHFVSRRETLCSAAARKTGTPHGTSETRLP